MKRKRFNLLHSLLYIGLLLIVERVVLAFLAPGLLLQLLIVAAALVGGAAIVVIATEVIEEVKSARYMLGLLSAVVFEFIIFFAFQYYFFILIAPGSFGSLTPTLMSMLLHSVMVFVFNPIYLPTTGAGQALMFVNVLVSLALALFVLQNIWQFRSKKEGI